jgi:YesN/AraC family two-component response regulator
MIHLLLTDVVMPRMNGRALARAVQDFRPDIKVLYMSGYTDNVIVHQGILDPGTPFLEKSFSPSKLARKVREVLDPPH